MLYLCIENIQDRSERIGPYVELNKKLLSSPILEAVYLVFSVTKKIVRCLQLQRYKNLKAIQIE